MAFEQKWERGRMGRDELFEVGEITSGAALASHRELAGRLEQAGRHLDGAFYDAHKRVEQKEGERKLANRDQEIAERLKQKAARALMKQMDLPLQSLPRRSWRSEEHTSELQSLMRISYAVSRLKQTMT